MPVAFAIVIAGVRMIPLAFAVLITMTSLTRAEAPRIATTSDRSDETLTIDEAFPPTIRFGDPSDWGRVDRIDIERGELLWISAHVTTRGGDNVVVPLDVPAGTRILGMQLAHEEAVVWGQAMAPERAQLRFAKSFSPALISWHSTTADVDHLELRIDAVHRHAETTITLAIELPRAMNLHVEPARIVRIDHALAHGPIAVFPAAVSARSRHVDAQTSIVAEDAMPRVVFESDWGPIVTASIDSHMIRRRVKLHIPSLRHCYERELQAHPDLEGHVELHFTIDEDGRVSKASVDGALASDAVMACMTAEVVTWEFPSAFGGGGTAVNYPLELKVAR